MHILSYANRNEFLANPQLIRFDNVEGSNGPEPTLLIKASSLLLKYIISGSRIQISFKEHNGLMIYALKVYDDIDDGNHGIIWSVAETQREIDAIIGVCNELPLVTFLFNELAVNVSWNESSNLKLSQELLKIVEKCNPTRFNYEKDSKSIISLLSELHEDNNIYSSWVSKDIVYESPWNEIRSTFITSSTGASLVNIFEGDEGNQQEQIGIWLTDNLTPSGVHHSPQRTYKKNETRELSDILISHKFGAILIESKTLSILSRETLPGREKLKRNLSKHISKAFDQLKGGIKTIKDGANIFSKNGQPLSIDRENPAHAIVLIPELSLIEDYFEYDSEFIKNFVAETKSFPHILDIAELLRVIQAAEMISSRSDETSAIMAFDYYLVGRFERAVEANTLCIQLLLRFSDDI